jgi:steroid delta-isomerase-like uncharacterized protein
MNWEMLAALGQLAAVLVGIPSLIYLAVQIRAQTKERRQSAVNALTVQWGDLTCALHDSAELSAIFLRGAKSFADLDPVSKLRFSAFFNRLINHFEAMYFSHLDGLLTASSWGKIERTLIDFIAYPGIQQWWEERRHWHTEEFGCVVDAIIAKGDEPKSSWRFTDSLLNLQSTRDHRAEDRHMNDLAGLTKFARRYAEAWCSQNPESVAAFYAENASLSVNDGPPAVGRMAIAKEAQAFMTTFPDMIVTMDKVAHDEEGTKFHWTLTGTNTGPGGEGKRVRISGYELWKIDNDGLIAESKGHFDTAEYEHQLSG